jgi:predicted aldo/keto reductase-like oxidoreductase
MTKEDVLQELDALAVKLRRKKPSDHDLESVMDQLRSLEAQVERAPDEEKLSILGLKGLGKEVWADIDADEYVDQLRDAWPRR